MDNDYIDQIIGQCIERDEEAYAKLRTEFEKRVANLDSVPEVSRIYEIEKIWGELNESRKAIASDAIQSMLKMADEAKIIDSKKESTKRKG